MIRSAFAPQTRKGKYPSAAAASAAGMLGLLLFRNKTHAEERSNSRYDDPSNNDAKSRGLIEVDLMDKIASKPYVNYHNTHSSSSGGLVRRSSDTIVSKFRRGGGALSGADTGQLSDYDEYADAGRWDEADGGGGGIGGGRRRPRGVPRRIRVLAIDVPEFREVFDGECRVNLSRVFPDDTAPPKRIRRRAKQQTSSKSDSSNNDDGENRTKKANAKTKRGNDEEEQRQQLEVIQKSFARSLVRCRNRESKRIGVEVLEASVYDLNPHNMRRTYQFGGYRYDPGKYATMRAKPGERKMSRKKTAEVASGEKGAAEADEDEADDDEVGPADAFEDDEAVKTEMSDFQKGRRSAITAENDDLDAPWNQYAWIEEMQLRISGLVPFGTPVERSSLWSRYVFGGVYRRTIPSSRGYLGRILPSFLTGEKFGDDGIDGDYGRRGGGGRTPNRASAKPHAVIADGAAMQRVPGSLRHLTKCCREADVPLFIVNDPRVWGGNTHSDLESAAADMRRVIKARVVVNALNIKEGSMFERGRLLGKIETEARWQAKDAGRRTRQAVRDAQSRLKKEREDDWSHLGGKELHERLVARKVIIVEKGNKKGEASSIYTGGMLDLLGRVKERSSLGEEDEDKRSDEVGSPSDDDAKESETRDQVHVVGASA